MIGFAIAFYILALIAAIISGVLELADWKVKTFLWIAGAAVLIGSFFLGAALFVWFKHL